MHAVQVAHRTCCSLHGWTADIPLFLNFTAFSEFQPALHFDFLVCCEITGRKLFTGFHRVLSLLTKLFLLDFGSSSCLSIFHVWCLHASINQLSSAVPLAGKGLSHRPRPSSPFSTDGSTVGTHSLGHQRATRPTRKPRSQGTAPHRRDAGADGTPVTDKTF